MSKPVRLRVDWAACDGHGLCEQWAPELITRDEWGFPIVADGPVPKAALEHARAAVLACPVLALKLLPAS
ncbi:MAG: ferredoxin [Mycobacteriales bacterium]